MRQAHLLAMLLLSGCETSYVIRPPDLQAYSTSAADQRPATFVAERSDGKTVSLRVDVLEKSGKLTNLDPSHPLQLKLRNPIGTAAAYLAGVTATVTVVGAIVMGVAASGLCMGRNYGSCCLDGSPAFSAGVGLTSVGALGLLSSAAVAIAGRHYGEARRRIASAPMPTAWWSREGGGLALRARF